MKNEPLLHIGLVKSACQLKIQKENCSLANAYETYLKANIATYPSHVLNRCVNM